MKVPFEQRSRKEEVGAAWEAERGRRKDRFVLLKMQKQTGGCCFRSRNRQGVAAWGQRSRKREGFSNLEQWMAILEHPDGLTQGQSSQLADKNHVLLRHDHDNVDQISARGRGVTSSEQEEARAACDWKHLVDHCVDTSQHWSCALSARPCLRWGGGVWCQNDKVRRPGTPDQSVPITDLAGLSEENIRPHCKYDSKSVEWKLQTSDSVNSIDVRNLERWGNLQICHASSKSNDLNKMSQRPERIITTLS